MHRATEASGRKRACRTVTLYEYLRLISCASGRAESCQVHSLQLYLAFAKKKSSGPPSRNRLYAELLTNTRVAGSALVNVVVAAAAHDTARYDDYSTSIVSTHSIRIT